MSDRTERIRKLEVPIIVLLGEKTMPLSQVMRLGPGSIIELPKMADEKLELMVNNKIIGRGDAVKVGENFGLEITERGQTAAKVEVIEDANEILGNDDIEALTASLLAN